MASLTDAVEKRFRASETGKHIITSGIACMNCGAYPFWRFISTWSVIVLKASPEVMQTSQALRAHRVVTIDDDDSDGVLGAVTAPQLELTLAPMERTCAPTARRTAIDTATTDDGRQGSANRQRGQRLAPSPHHDRDRRQAPRQQEGRTARRERRTTGTGQRTGCETRAYRGRAGFGRPFVRPAEVEKTIYFPALPPFSTGRKSR
jgi:hypothetical protein